VHNPNHRAQTRSTNIETTPLDRPRIAIDEQGDVWSTGTRCQPQQRHAALGAKVTEGGDRTGIKNDVVDAGAKDFVECEHVRPAPHPDQCAFMTTVQCHPCQQPVHDLADAQHIHPEAKPLAQLLHPGEFTIRCVHESCPMVIRNTLAAVPRRRPPDGPTPSRQAVRAAAGQSSPLSTEKSKYQLPDDISDVGSDRGRRAGHRTP
jgi:hypothetical protein